jgi:hypothetical protein
LAVTAARSGSAARDRFGGSDDRHCGAAIYVPGALIKQYVAEQRRRDRRVVTLVILATGAAVRGNDAKYWTTLVGCCA